MTEKEQTSAPETTDTNHAEAVINQTELSNKEELINQSLEPQTDQDAAPESEIETEPITVPVPTPVHSEITEDEQAKKLYDFYFGEQTQQNILESETQPEEDIIETTLKKVETTPDDDPVIEETANHLKENIENFKTFLPNPELLVPQQNRVVPPPKKFNPWLIGAIIGILIALICLCMLFFGNKERV